MTERKAETIEVPRRAKLRSAAGALAVAGGVFWLAVAVMMAREVLTRGGADLRNEARMVELKTELAAAEGQASASPERIERIAERIRRYDSELRADHFRRRAMMRRGAWLLAVGLAVFVLAAKALAALKQTSPFPEDLAGDSVEQAERLAARSRWAVALVAGLIGGVVAAAAMALRPAGPVEPRPALAMALARPTERWPRFRGPGGLGVSAAADVPISFDVKTGRGIRWRTAVPMPGKSSPIVWGRRVFCTGATKQRREVLCYDAETGKLLWRREVHNGPASDADRDDVFEATGWAAPTPATDGKCVAAIFGNMDLACFDFDGRKLWGRNLGIADNPYGHASSLLMWRGLVLVQFDQGEPHQGKSRLTAFDAVTGRIAWSARRPVGASWTTPILITKPTRQIVTASNPWVIAYDPATGDEVWRADECLKGDGAPSPTWGAGLVLAGNADSGLAAIRPGGTGDVTNTHVLWRGAEGLGETPSPLADGKRVYMLAHDKLVCYALAASGKPRKLWAKELGTSFEASPTLAGGRAYLLSRKGTLIVWRLGDTYTELARSELGARCSASPALVDGRLYVRTNKSLLCIETTKE